MLSNEVREVAQSIGQFYLKKNGGDIEKANQEIEALRITKIEVGENCVALITIERPGLLIGRMGTNIDALTQHLSSLCPKGIRILEESDPIGSWLMVTDPRNSDDFPNDIYSDVDPDQH